MLNYKFYVSDRCFHKICILGHNLWSLSATDGYWLLLSLGIKTRSIIYTLKFRASKKGILGFIRDDAHSHFVVILSIHFNYIEEACILKYSAQSSAFILNFLFIDHNLTFIMYTLFVSESLLNGTIYADLSFVDHLFNVLMTIICISVFLFNTGVSSKYIFTMHLKLIPKQVYLIILTFS